MGFVSPGFRGKRRDDVSLMRIVRGRSRYWIDLTGTRCLEFRD
jgi:hypothetical protein